MASRSSSFKPAAAASRASARRSNDRLETQLRQTLAPLLMDAAAPAPAKRLVAQIEDAAAAGGTIPAEDVRRGLFALGLSAEDTAALLVGIGADTADTVDAKLLAKMALPPGSGGQGGDRSQRTAADLHRKVLEKVLVKSKSHNVKDAFRQYDTERSGHLTWPQFRTLMRDHGFIGSDTERLIKYLDAENHQSISFHAFVGGQKLGTEQKYPKTSPKKPQVAPPLAAKGDSSPKAKARALRGSGQLSGKRQPSRSAARTEEPEDPMEAIRGRLRQRVMGRDKSIREVFMEFDGDGNGYLDYDEFERFMAHYRFSVEETRMAIRFLDRDDSGTIDYDEFAAGLLFYRAPVAIKPGDGHSAPSSIGQLPKSTVHPKAETGEILRRIQGKLGEIAKARRESEREERLGFLRTAFDKCDVDGCGSLDLQEFGAFLIGLGVKLRPDELSGLFDSLDKGQTQSVKFDDFAKACWVPTESLDAASPSPALDPGRSSSDSSTLRAVFSKYDGDGSGLITHDNLVRLLRDHGASDSEVSQVAKQIGEDQRSGGGRGQRSAAIDFEKFASVMESRNWDVAERKSASERDGSRRPTKKTMRQLPISEVALAQFVGRVMRQNRSLEEAFHQHDTDGSGELDVDEFRRFLKHYGMRRGEDIDALIEFIDADRSGFVSLDAFSRVFGRSTKPALNLNKPSRQSAVGVEAAGKREQSKRRLEALREQELAFMKRVMREHESMDDAFREFDRDGSNELDEDAFRDLMARYGVVDEQAVSLLLTKLDVDNSGTVDLDEFRTVFNPQRLDPRQVDRSLGAAAVAETPGRGHNSHTDADRWGDAARTWRSNALGVHESVEDAFDAFSRRGDGTLCRSDLCDLLAAYGVADDEEIDALLTLLDRDSSGVIYFDEFASVFGEPRRLESRHDPKNADSRTDSKADSGINAANVIDAAVESGRSRRTARLRELEVKWVQRALACHPSIADAFCQYDEDGNGELDHEEFQCFMKRYGIVRERDIETLLEILDVDGSGTVSLSEFSTVFHPARLPQAPEDDDELFAGDELASVLEIERDLAQRIAKQSRDLRLAFRKFDTNGNGLLEYKEFRAVLKAFRLPEVEIRKVIRHLDRDVSGFIEYKEFISGFSLSDATPAVGKRRTGGAMARSSPGRAGSVKKRQESGSPLKQRATVASSRKSGEPAASPSPRDTRVDASVGDALKKKLLARIQASHDSVQSAFRRYDASRAGRLMPDQFQRLATDFGLSREQALELQDALDRDGSGAIEYEEFLSQLVIRDSER